MADHEDPRRAIEELAQDCVSLVVAIDASDDLDRLRAGFRVLALALPDLLVSTTAAAAVVGTSHAALDGTWP